MDEKIKQDVKPLTKRGVYERQNGKSELSNLKMGHTVKKKAATSVVKN